MSQKLRALIIEDSPDDFQLLLRELQRNGYEVDFERVETENAMRTALSKSEWDLILCDYSLPQLNAPRALEILHASGRDLPFIIVSGTIGEETAVEALKAGANDFVIKGSFARLIPAIQREMRDTEVRRERKKVEEALKATQARLSGILDIAADAIIGINEQQKMIFFNQGSEHIFGYKANEVLGQPIDILIPQPFTEIHQDYVNEFLHAYETARQMGHRSEIFGRRKDGSEFPAEATISKLELDGEITFTVILRDVTDRKKSELALLESEQRFRQLFNASPDAILLIDPSDPDFWQILDCNETACKMNGYTRKELIGQPLDLLNITPSTREERNSYLERLRRKGVIQTEALHLHQDGHVFPIEISTSLILLEGRELVLGIDRDITLRKQAEEAIRKAEFQYRTLVEQLPIVVYINSSKDINDTTYVSPQIEPILGYTQQEWLENPKFWQEALDPEDRTEVIRLLEYSNRTSEPFDMEYRMTSRAGGVVWFRDQALLVRDSEGKPLFWQGLKINITDRKEAEESLGRQDVELHRRNKEITRLYRASEALLAGQLTHLPSLANVIVHTVLDEFQQSNCSLLLVNKEKGEFERIAVGGPYSEQVSRSRLRLDDPGLVAKAFKMGQIINAHDVSKEPDYIPNWKKARSELVIPLKVGDDFIGALDVQSPELNAFHADDERLMSIFAERAALGIERARLYEQTIKQLERLESLRTIDLAISNSLDIRVSLNIVLDQIVTQLKVDAAAVLLMKSEFGQLNYIAGRGFRTHRIEETKLRLGEGLAGMAALERQVLQASYTGDVGNTLVPRKLFEDEKFVSYYGVPLIAKGGVNGVLEIFHRSELKPDMDWLNFLDGLGWQTAIAVDNAMMFQGIQRSNIDLTMAYEATIEGWSRALDLRDKETEGHTQRVTEMTVQFASVMGISEEQILHIRRGALLHDIGKMGVPDKILLKEGPLTPKEWQTMKQHPQFAFDLLSPISYLKHALDIPYCHHEKWDGSGYPRGLSGSQIPIEARLFAIVDVWDAITSDRPYRKRWTKRKSLQYIREQSGKHFDPDVVKVFLKEIVR